MNMNLKNRKNAGQTLVEAIIAVSVVLLLVTGLVAGTSASLKSSQSGRSRDQAVKLAEEGLEYARSLRDSSWSTLTAYSGSYCFDPSSETKLVLAVSGTCATKKTTSDTVFTRILSFTLSASKVTIQSTVSYVENNRVQNTTLVTYLTQWK